jgi:hypothetical protein
MALHPSDTALFNKPAAKRKPRAYCVTWWQHINLGGIGRVERATFYDRISARTYVAAHSIGMSDKDKRRWKIEAVY